MNSLMSGEVDVNTDVPMDESEINYIINQFGYSHPPRAEDGSISSLHGVGCNIVYQLIDTLSTMSLANKERLLLKYLQRMEGDTSGKNCMMNPPDSDLIPKTLGFDLFRLVVIDGYTIPESLKEIGRKINTLLENHKSFPE